MPGRPINQLEEHGLKTDKKTAKALAASAGRIVAGAVLPRLAVLGTGIFIPESALSAMAAGAVSEITAKTVDQAVKHHEEARDEVERFRSILARCAETIATRDTGQVKKLIVFVDELDRCRPDYAVHVLECIKHFFSVDHVIFVLAIDSKAVTESIRSVYGPEVDVDGYLRKFFDYHVELGSPQYGNFARLLMQSLRLHEVIHDRVSEWLEAFPSWCRALELSLRVQEQTLSQASFIARTYRSLDSWLVYDLVLFLLCLRAKDPGLIGRIAAGEVTYDRLTSELEPLVDLDDDIEQSLQYAIVILLAGFRSPEAIKADFEALERKFLQDESLPPKELVAVKRKLEALRDALTITAQGPHLGDIGRGIVRRIRFLAE